MVRASLSARIVRFLAVAWVALCAPYANAADPDGDGVDSSVDLCPQVADPEQFDRGGLGSFAPNGRGDACECGDVSGDGVAHVNDYTILRRALAGLGPGLARPDLCNVNGPRDDADPDGDGIPAECGIDDYVLLARALVGLGPAPGTACGAAASDLLPPQIELSAPAEVQSGAPFVATAEVSDNRGVDRVRFEVDGLLVADVEQEPFELRYTASGLPGEILTLRARAFDLVGNESSVLTEVQVVAEPDTVPPIIESIQRPPTAAPGEAVGVSAVVRDDRGVAFVRFLRDGVEFGSDDRAPFRATLTVPADATAGSSLGFEVLAEDLAGNSAQAQAGIAIAEQGDGAPPFDVTLVVPAEGRAGETLTASAGASDDVGVFAMDFFVAGARVATDPDPPYEATWRVPDDVAPGTVVTWRAEASDFAGNRSGSPEASTVIAAPGAGQIVGEVYDDATGRPLPGVSVRALAGGGLPLDPPLASVTDLRGRYVLTLAPGVARVIVEADGYTSVLRRTDVRVDRSVAPLDARLTPLAEPFQRDPAALSRIDVESGVSVVAPPGSLGASGHATALGEQGLPEPLPPGWSPIAAVQIDSVSIGSAYTVEIQDVPAGALAATWSAPTGWVHRPSNLDGDTLQVSRTTLGALAVVVPDPGAGPSAPAIGASLTGIAPSPSLPAEAELLPGPDVLVSDPAARSDVELRFAGPVVSGTRVSVAFSEVYDLSDGRRFSPFPFRQDLVLYRRGAQAIARFVASPARGFDPVLLTEGVIHLEAEPIATSEGAILDANGGTVRGEGVALTLPEGALPGRTASSARVLAAREVELLAGELTGVLGAFELTLGDAELANPAELAFALPPGSSAAGTVLVVRAFSLADETLLELVARGRVEDGSVLVDGADTLAFPGVRAEGRYLLVAPEEPYGFLTGELTQRAGSAGEVLVSGAGFPFVQRLPGSGAWVLAARVGSVEAAALDLANGDTAAGSATVPAAGEIAALDLTLAPARLTVASIDPPDGASDVAASRSVVIRFSSALDPATVSGTAVALTDPAGEVASSVALGADGRSVVLRPAELLASETPYMVSVSAALGDVFGRTLLGNLPDESFSASFVTRDTTPPAPPEPGQISTGFPDAGGVVVIAGTQGTAEPGARISAVNETSGSVATVIAGVDGSFSIRLVADVRDTVRLIVRDLAGNETAVAPGPFDDGQGKAVVGADGGVVRTPDGSEFEFAPGSFAEPAVVQLRRLDESEVPIGEPVDFGLGFAGSFSLDTGGAELLQPLEMRLKVDESYEPDSVFLVAQLEEVGGQLIPNLRDTARFEDGFIVINSPPWPGIAGTLAQLIIVTWLSQSRFTFVTGDIYTAPRIGAMAMTYPQTLEVTDNEALIDITASVTLPEIGDVEKMELLDKDDEVIATVMGPEKYLRSLVTVPITDLEAGFVSFADFVGQQVQAKRWKLRVTFKTADGTTIVEEARGETTILPQGSTQIVDLFLPPSNSGTQAKPRGTAARYVHRKEYGFAKPSEGVWVSLYLGASAYPALTTTSASGGFVLAADPGITDQLRVMDPVTGNGTSFTVNVPQTQFDFVDVGRIYIPEVLGDGIPPTVDIQVDGTLIEGETLTLDVNATDNEALSRVKLEFGNTVLLDEEPNADTFQGSALFTPPLNGQYHFVATATDATGSETRREIQVGIRQDYGDLGTASLAEDISLEVGSTGVDPNVKVYIDLASTIDGGVPLGVLPIPGLDIFFRDVATGNDIAVVGGTVSNGGQLVISPLSPLPYGADLELHVNGEVIAFRTRGLDLLRDVAGFSEIRGVDGRGGYAYVADYGAATPGIKVVDLFGLNGAAVVHNVSLPGPARDVAVSGNRLVAIAGGQNVLPVLRVYDLDNPAQPQQRASVVLFPTEGIVIPTNLEVSDNLAYVATIGSGVQVVNLAEAERIGAIPFLQRKPEERNAQTAIIGGFRLPNLDAEPELRGVAVDATVALPGLMLTGGSESRLYVVSDSIPGVNVTIDQNSTDLPWFDLPANFQRVSAQANVLLATDLFNDGVLDFRSVNLAAISHGNAGLSFLDVTRPDEVQLRSTVSWGTSVLDTLFLDRYVFTGDRLVGFSDPVNPLVGGALSYTDPEGTTSTLSAGGDVALAALDPLPGGFRQATLLASSASRQSLQIADVILSPTAVDWDIVRTASYRSQLSQKAKDYLNTGDPVNPFTGEFELVETDLAIPGRGLDFAFERTYRSGIGFRGPLGHGWDHVYNDRLTLDLESGGVTRYDGTGRTDLFVAEGQSFAAPPGVFAELESVSATGSGVTFGGFGQASDCGQDGRFTLTMPDGRVHHYEPTRRDPQRYFRLECIEDRYGNRLRFEYDLRDQLVTIVDTMDREVELGYDSRGHLRSLTDSAGRRTSYSYDFDDNLLTWTTPATGAFPQGKTTTYTYSSGFPAFDSEGVPQETARLNHNLLSVTDPAGQEYIRNAYHPTTDPADIEFDRVATHRLGDPSGEAGGIYSFAYSGQDGVLDQATLTNRTGAVTRRSYDSEGLGRLEKIEADVTIDGQLETLVTEFAYTPDGLLDYEISPSGIETDYTWAEEASERTRQADLLRVETSAPDEETIAWSWTRGAFGSPLTEIDPEGNVTTWTLNAAGDPVEVVHPLVKLPDGTPQQAVERFTYGGRGEVLSRTLATGEVTRFAYHPTCRQGTRIPDDCTDADATQPGYLASVTLDSATGGVVAGIGVGIEGPAPANAKTSYEYDLVGNLIELTDARGRVETRAVNALNQALEIADPRGTTTYRYDANGNFAEVVEERDRLPKLTRTYEYDALNQLVSVEEAGGESGGLKRTITFGYDASENEILSVSGEGNVSRTEYDERALPIRVETAADLTGERTLLAEFVYDADGRLVSERSGEGQLSSFERDGLGRLRATVDALDVRAEFDYDARGFLVETRVRDAAGVARSIRRESRDARGRVERTEEALLDDRGSELDAAVTQYIHDPSDRLIRSVDPNGRSVDFTVDGLGRTLTATDAAGNSSIWTYDSLDPKSLTELRLGVSGQENRRSVEFEYDALGRLTERRIAPGSPEERVATSTWTGRDSLASETATGGTTTTLTRDAFDRVVRIDRGDRATVFAYDRDDRLTRIEDALGRGVDYERDERGRVERVVWASGTETLTWRDDDRLATRVDRAGNGFTHRYDATGRLERIDVSANAGFEGVTARTWAYDALGRIIATDALGPAGTRSLDIRRDSLGRVLTETFDARSVARAYDLGGSLRSVGVPGGAALELRRDTLGRLTEIRGGNTVLASWEYLGLRPSAASFANGTSVGRTFGSAFDEAERAYRDAAQALQTGFALARDPAGRLVGIARDHDGGAGDAYGYDTSGRLALERRGVADPLASDRLAQTATVETQWAYDASGNFETRTRDGVPESFSANALNQYTGAAGAAPSYDSNGNLRDDGVQAYAYDAFGQLRTVTRIADGAVLAQYDYDALGRRRVVSRGAQREELVYVGGDVVGVYDDSGALVREFVYGDTSDRPVLMRTSAGDLYFQYDPLGSVVAVSDASGAVVERYAYDAWGVQTVLAPGGTPRPSPQVAHGLGFRGRPQDLDTGLVHMRARDYVPALGRFLQPDPAGTVDGPNVYAYVGNDPVNFFDPSGLFRQASANDIKIGSLGGLPLTSALAFGKIAGVYGTARGRLGTIKGLTGEITNPKNTIGDVIRKKIATDLLDKAKGDLIGVAKSEAKRRLKRQNPKLDPKVIDLAVDLAFESAEGALGGASNHIKQRQADDLFRHRPIERDPRTDEQKFADDVEQIEATLNRVSAGIQALERRNREASRRLDQLETELNAAMERTDAAARRADAAIASSEALLRVDVDDLIQGLDAP